MIQAIFFDFNGVIIDDERIHLKAYRDVLAERDIPLTDEDYFASLGMDDVAFVRAAYGRAEQRVDDVTLRDLIDREHALHRQLISNQPPIAAGIVTFIKTVARRYELGIVSMAERSEIDVPGKLRMEEKGLQFRTEIKVIAADRIVQRLDSKSVARKYQPAA